MGTVRHVTYACGCVYTDKPNITEWENGHSFHKPSHIKPAEEHKVMTMDCRDCLHAKLAKEKEKNAAVHTAVEKLTTDANLAKEGENMSAVHTAVDKSTTHAKLGQEKRKSAMVHAGVDKQKRYPKPTKKVRWEEASK